VQRSKLLPFVVLGAIACGTGAAPAADPPEWNAKCGDLDCRVEWKQAPWQVLALYDEQLLQVEYQSDACSTGAPSYRIERTPTRVHLTVLEQQIVAIDSPRPLNCASEQGYGNFHIGLKHPVAGRHIVGGPRPADHSRDPYAEPGLVPDEEGLAKQDAVGALRYQGFRVRTLGRRHGAVAFQSPLPGRRARNGIVRLTIGRHNIRTRRMKSCLRRVANACEGAGAPRPRSPRRSGGA
jgi:hypothetical protein